MDQELPPDFDYFEEERPPCPKFSVGQYVLDQGFNVPVITSKEDWQSAFDEGLAMIRSEMTQDYGGYSGLLSSERLGPDLFEGATGVFEEYGRLVLQGVRDMEIDPASFMLNYRGFGMSWANRWSHMLETALRFNSEFFHSISDVDASGWRYIEGTNVTIFGDPNVAGRYHFGVSPYRENSFNSDPIGDYQVEANEHEVAKTYRNHREPFVAKPFIDIYEQIQSLPYFDNTQNPVLELQQDLDGDIHFLQYLKTGQKRNFIEPFDLPTGDEVLTLPNTRGVTSQEGRQLRLFIVPQRFAKGMIDQAVLCGGLWPSGLEVQIIAMQAAFVLHESYVSLKDNHFDSSPLIRPPLASGLRPGSYERNSGQLLERVQDILDKTHRFEFSRVPYVDIKVTSNGREAAIESDWSLNYIDHNDID